MNGHLQWADNVPRTRTVADEDILDAAIGILRRGGPVDLTLARVGAAVGLSPATLVQRYGTKNALMRAALLSMWDRLDAATAAADARRPVNIEGAVSMLAALSGGYGESADEHAQGLLLLREDFRDPALRARGVAWGEALTRALGRRLTDDPARQPLLGKLMASQWQGCLIWWGFSRDGSLRSYVRRELRDWCRAVLGD